MMNMHRQAEKFGAEFKYAEVQEFEPVNGHYRLNVDGESIEVAVGHHRQRCLRQVARS